MKIIVNGVKVSTDSYAGNFERELTAYCTGHIGECGVGYDEGIDFMNYYSSNLLEGVEQIPDEYGTERPVKLDNDPNNLIIIFEDNFNIAEGVVELVKERAIEFAGDDFKILDVQAGEFILNRL